MIRVVAPLDCGSLLRFKAAVNGAGNPPHSKSARKRRLRSAVEAETAPASPSLLPRCPAHEYIASALINDSCFDKSAHQTLGLRATFWASNDLHPRGGKLLMRMAHTGRLAKLGAGAFSLLLLHGLYAPTAAWAGCQHDVVAPRVAVSARHGLDDLIATTTPSATEDGPAQSRPERSLPGRRLPCSGLSCSSRIPLPVSAVSGGMGEAHQWGDVTTFVILYPASPRAGMPDECAPLPAGQCSSIFHPPRV